MEVKDILDNDVKTIWQEAAEKNWKTDWLNTIMLAKIAQALEKNAKDKDDITFAKVLADHVAQRQHEPATTNQLEVLQKIADGEE
jgi:cobalamin biosynthesis protein CbiD